MGARSSEVRFAPQSGLKSDIAGPLVPWNLSRIFRHKNPTNASESQMLTTFLP